MRLLTYQADGGLALGVLTDEGVLDVAAAASALGAGNLPSSAEAFFKAGNAALPQLRSLVEQARGRMELYRSEAGLRLGPCVAAPCKILCVGLNYRRHAVETGAAIPQSPVLFSKFLNSLAAHGEHVPLPDVTQQADYEVELGVVIGRHARDVSVEDALSYVFGYCTMDDISARDLQMRTSQWLLGKTLDKFQPIGPYTVTADEVPDPQSLRLRTWVNGDLRQDSTTGDMIFSVAEIISYASRHFALEPGDVISTGTPEGVIQGMPEPRPWLKKGDLVAVEVEGLGRLENRLV